MRPRFSRIILLTVIITMLLFTSCKNVSDTDINSEYIPTLAKTSETLSIKIYDLKNEKRYAMINDEGLELQEMYLAILSIQGIVNRTSPEKIYFINSPNGTFDELKVWNNNQSIDEWCLENDEVPVPSEEAEIDESKKWPVLSALIRDYGEYIKGGIIIPNVEKSVPRKRDADVAFIDEEAPSNPDMLIIPLIKIDNAICAAATCAGQTDGILLSERINKYIKNEGYELEIIEDCRGLLNAKDAFDWAFEKYFNEDTNMTSIRMVKTSSYPSFVNTFDYFIATKTFITTADPVYEQYRFEKLAAKYPKGINIFTNYEFKPEIYEYEDLGFTHAIITGSNFSVHSGFKSDPELLKSAREPKAYTTDNNAAYISFYVTDGDSCFYSNYANIVTFNRSKALGEVPIGWSYPMHMFDIFPNQLYRRVEFNNKYNYELVGNSIDSCAPTTKEGQEGFIKIYKNYLDNTGNTFSTVNYIFDWNKVGERVMNEVAPRYLLWGYAGPITGGSSNIARNADGTLYTSLCGATQELATFDSIVKTAENVINNAKKGRPAFMCIVLGDGAIKRRTPELAKKVCDRLNELKPGGRDLIYLTPSDMFATYEEYMDKSSEK